MQQELGFGDDRTGKLFTAFSCGLTPGALIWGILVDIVGRRWAFNLTVLISSIFGLCLAIPDSYSSILVITSFVGFGVGGNTPIDTTITLEFTPQNRRYILPLLSVFQPIGLVVYSAIAPNFSEAGPLAACNAVAGGERCCAEADNMGWRYLLYTLGSVTLCVSFLRFIVFQFQKSPKFLIYRGRDAEAVQVLQHVAKMNGTILGGSAKQLQPTWKETIRLESPRFKLLFSNSQMTRTTILVWLTYIFDYWGFTVDGKPSSLSMSLSIFALTTINTAASNIGLRALKYFLQSMFNAVLYGWTPVDFPAPVRGTAWHLVAQGVHAGGTGGGENGDALLWLAGGVALGCVVTTALLPGRARGRGL
ncbi:MFS general substrate transporter [Lentithecium fluviatile CBS 122367]|uniref:MFS general substrate transporter n=1 Tax=Lentithecium fluviatile CBS 122367 TaxID=1168545 RepID=A0A6G1IVN5_9PLEO|nr:MFS general substrate transporter [Lentithecium fluviatile CBS 122367]